MSRQSAVDDLTCRRARRAFSLALDGEPGAAEILVAASHLKRCESCRRFAADVVAFTYELRSLREEDESTAAEDSFRRRGVRS